jgi:type I restriction enzyme, S subunit
MNKVQKSVISSQLPKGYKQTEVGVIPEDWSVKIIGEIADVRTGPFGSALHEKDYVSDGTPIITVEHLGEMGVKHTNLPMVSNEDRLRLKAYSLNKGDLVFSRVGSVDRNALIKKAESGWLFSSRLLRVRLNSKNNDPQYLSYHFHSESFKQRVRDVAVGQTMASLNTQILKGVKVFLPTTREEQEVIAHALSDIDALIESLDRLLTKKRQIKKGAMQELLRSKDGWIATKLKDVAPLQRGFDLPSSQLQQGVYPVVYSNGVQNHHHKYMVKRPGVTTGRSGTLGVINFIDEDFWPHNTTLWVTDFKGNYPKFIYYLYDHIGFEHFGSGSGVPTLNRNDAHDYLCFIPSKLDEQIEIATILSDMDAEIDSIEAKLTKTRQIKQGMMHELLTGRIRLV